MLIVFINLEHTDKTAHITSRIIQFFWNPVYKWQVHAGGWSPADKSLMVCRCHKCEKKGLWAKVVLVQLWSKRCFNILKSHSLFRAKLCCSTSSLYHSHTLLLGIWKSLNHWLTIWAVTGFLSAHFNKWKAVVAALCQGYVLCKVETYKIKYKLISITRFK